MANIFPRMTSNSVPLKVVIALLMTVTAATAGVWYYCSPNYVRGGLHADAAPVPYSHCRLSCTSGSSGWTAAIVILSWDRSPHANLPGSSVCMNCHSPDLGNVLGDSPKLAPIRDSYFQWPAGAVGQNSQ